MSKNKKYYAVVCGKKRGIFDNWEDCFDLTNHCSNNKYKSFKYFIDAQEFFFDNTNIWLEEDDINKKL